MMEIITEEERLAGIRERVRRRDAMNDGLFVSTRDLADAAGLRSADTALPLAWYEDVHEKTGFWPQSYGFVWCYEAACMQYMFGHPHPLSEAATILLAFYEKVRS